MERLKLTINETKTKLCVLPGETFNFLGYTFGRLYSPRTGGAYLGACPAEKKIRKLCDSISELTRRRFGSLDTAEMVGRLNRKLRGWGNYFRFGMVSKAYSAVNRHVAHRLRQWLLRKHKQRGSGFTRYPDSYLYQDLGLVRLRPSSRNPPCAKA
jgi:RNA-directed DNA polymerase